MLPPVRLSQVIRALAETILMFACAGVVAQTSLLQEPAGNRDSSQLMQPGIVVAKVEQGYQGLRAGMRAGDVLLSWSQGDLSGNFESPFDFIKVDLDQRPLAPVTLHGLQGGEARSWTLAPTTWGLETEPRFAVSPSRLRGSAGGKTNSDSVYLELTNDPRITSQISWLRSWLLMHRAKELAQKKRWKEAEGSYKQTFEASSELGHESRSYILRTWGDLARDRGDWEAAKDLYLRALDESNKIGHDNSSTAESLRSLGLLEEYRKGWSDAKSYLLGTLQIEKRLGSYDRARELGDLGSVLMASGDLSTADDYLTQSLALYGGVDSSGLDIATTYRRQAYAAFYRSDLIRAESCSRQALKIDLTLSTDNWRRAAMLQTLGIIAWHRGDYNRAEKLVRQSVEMNRKVAPESTFLAGTLVNLGSVARSLGKLSEAERYLEQALAIAQRKQLPELVPRILDNLGGIFRERGHLALAERYFHRALDLEPNQDDFAAADILRDLGRVANLSGNSVEARRYYERALPILEKTVPGSRWLADDFAVLGNIARRQGRVKEAARLYEQALRVFEGHTSLLGGSDKLRADFRAKHQDFYREYIDLLLTQNQPDLAFEVLERSRARTLLETLATADLDIRKGVDPELIKKERSLQGDIKAKSERRVHLLSEKQSEDQGKAIEKEISTLTSEYQDVEAQIRSTSPEYTALTQPQPLSANEIREQLLDPDTFLLEYSLGLERSHVFVVSTDSLVAYELPKRAVIEAAARRTYGLLTARNRRISGEKPAERAARIAQAEAEFPQAAARLSRMVLGPIADKLAGKRLLIVSDGALHYVPFAALPVHGAGKAAVPLMAQYEVVNLPSASVVAVLRRERLGRKPGAKAVAVLADPVFDSADVRVKGAVLDEPHSIAKIKSGEVETQTGDVAQKKTQAQPDPEFADEEESLALAQLTRSAADVGWKRTHRGEVYLPRLQSTRREADAIMAVTPPGQSFEALDFKANRATATSAELANYRIVHFATHALLNSKHPELSGLVLSLVDERGRPQSGFLGLEDIYNLNLPAELVVLSACETALGKDIEGEGMVGLTRGFMYAGASRVMASLWNIDDRATADQMKYFYRAMVGQGMRPAAALRAAQLKMRKDPRWSSPYFWAAFQIQGEWK